jgi:hypothetical protein
MEAPARRCLTQPRLLLRGRSEHEL